MSMQSLLIRPEPPPQPQTGILTREDAIDIWIARWLNIRRIDILRRYNCDPRRLYEIWEGSRFPDSRDSALEIFLERYPTLKDRVDFGNHRRIPRAPQSPDQLTLFAEENT